MGARGTFATASLIATLTAGCAAEVGTGEVGAERPSEQTLASDEPLEVAVDSLDVVHGALRISATMVDGSADVSVRLGGDCKHDEVGGGISTLSTLVWALGDDDLAAAIACGLTVRARVRDGRRYVNKVADLAVAIDLEAQESEDTEDAPRLQIVTMSAAGVSADELASSVLKGRLLVLDGASFAISLSVGGTSLETESQGPDVE